jgi:uncharacterized membrane protein YagU involved in acid resistance
MRERHRLSRRHDHCSLIAAGPRLVLGFRVFRDEWGKRVAVTNRIPWSAVFLGGLIAGTIDIGSAALINWLSPLVILHAIASGMLGRASFFEGATSAILGLLLQWAMSLIIAAVFVLSSRVLPGLVRFWAAAGIAYGVVIFFVMNYVVVPLSAATPTHDFPHFTPARFAGNMVAMLLFGLIVAYFAQRSAHEAEPAP